jgi:hypothetical protein
MTTTWGAAFGDGWNGSLINPLTRAEAAARDHSGDPYAVVLLGGDRVRAEIRVAWAEEYLAVIRYDARGRTRSVHEFRPTAEGDLTLWTQRTWDGPEELSDEEFARTATRDSVTWHRGDGRREHHTEPKGDVGGSGSEIGFEAAPRFPRPAFGQWSALLDRAGAGPVEVIEAHRPSVLATEDGRDAGLVGADHDLPVTHDAAMPWRTPAPRGPGDLAGLFTDGVRRTIAGDDPAAGPGRTARIEVVPAGKLRVPSGRLAAVDPGEVGSEEAPTPFLVAIEPGVYPVTVSRAHLEGQDGNTRVAGVRLDVTDRPVASWEMARKPGQEMLDLAEGHFFGVGVDSGCAGLVDPGLWDTLGDDDDAHDLTVDMEEFTLHRDGGMLAYSAGWGDGSYPTWIGRDAAGEVVCFVTDMLL